MADRPLDALRTELRRWRDEPLTRVSLEASLLRPWRRRQFGVFGARSIVHRPTWLYGTRHASIGSDVLVFHGAWLSVERPAWDRPEPALRIGDRVLLRSGCTISAAAGVTIGDDVTVAGGVSILDSDHTWRGGSPNVMHSPLEASPITIGAGSWIGEHCVVLRGSVIGAGCLIAANSVVKGEIPDGSVAAGSPARVVGRTDHLR